MDSVVHVSFTHQVALHILVFGFFWPSHPVLSTICSVRVSLSWTMEGIIVSCMHALTSLVDSSCISLQFFIFRSSVEPSSSTSWWRTVSMMGLASILVLGISVDVQHKPYNHTNCLVDFEINSCKNITSAPHKNKFHQRIWFHRNTAIGGVGRLLRTPADKLRQTQFPVLGLLTEAG